MTLIDRLEAAEAGLFADLPKFPVALPDDELRLLARLPTYDTTQEIEWEDESACRRLEKRGLVKVHRQKDDPIAMRPTMYAGKLPAAALARSPEDGKQEKV